MRPDAVLSAAGSVLKVEMRAYSATESEGPAVFELEKSLSPGEVERIAR